MHHTTASWQQLSWGNRLIDLLNVCASAFLCLGNILINWQSTIYINASIFFFTSQHAGFVAVHCSDSLCSTIGFLCVKPNSFSKILSYTNSLVPQAIPRYSALETMLLLASSFLPRHKIATHKIARICHWSRLTLHMPRLYQYMLSQLNVYGLSIKFPFLVTQDILKFFRQHLNGLAGMDTPTGWHDWRHMIYSVELFYRYISFSTNPR